jgi:septal ring factor EnvC (AmiA/AmiB activator)
VFGIAEFYKFRFGEDKICPHPVALPCLVHSDNGQLGQQVQSLTAELAKLCEKLKGVEETCSTLQQKVHYCILQIKELEKKLKEQNQNPLN